MFCIKRFVLLQNVISFCKRLPKALSYVITSVVVPIEYQSIKYIDRFKLDDRLVDRYIGIDS